MLPELATAMTELDDLSNQAKQIIQTLEPAALNFKPADDINSIYATTTHIAGSLEWWLGEIVAGRAARRDREAEFRAAGADAAALVCALDDALSLARMVLEGVTPAHLDETRHARTLTVTVRWIIPHVLAHTALHLGHLQITAQLWWLHRAQETA